MSNMIKKFKKAKQVDTLYNSLIGSAVLTTGITTGRTEKECRDYFNMLKKNKKVLGNSVSSIMDYVWTTFGNDDLKEIRASYILVYDKNDIRSPMISYVSPDGNVMPLRKEGFSEVNILSLAAEGRDWIDVEFLYDENGDSFDEEEQTD